MVAELRNEISVLKAEVTELRSALLEERKRSQALATEIASLRRSDKTTIAAVRSYASAATRNVQLSDNRATRRRRRQTQQRPRSESTAAPSQDTNDAVRSSDRESATAPTPRETVSGARRVWGTPKISYLHNCLEGCQVPQ